MTKVPDAPEPTPPIAPTIAVPPPTRIAPTLAAPAPTDGIAPTLAVAGPLGAGAKAPQRLGPYVIERELARGGMGAVFLARHVELGREVALKLTLSGEAADDARFEREARALAAFQHPNLVTLHDAGTDGGRRWMALELVRGGSLQDRLDREGPLPPRAAVEQLELVARAIVAAHERGLLHRDLKPANVLVDEQGRPKVTDFGLAKSLGAQSRDLTRTGAMMGTPSYAAPEQLNDASAADVRADVYGLGATLFALLTARPPFEGELTKVLANVAATDALPPSALRRGVPGELDLVVLRCLAKDPALRYPTAAALADELGRWLRDEPLEVRPPSLAQRLRGWRRRRPILTAALLLTLPLGGAAAFAASTWRGAPVAAREVTQVEWLVPIDGETTQARSLVVRGIVSGPAEWVDVNVVGATTKRRVRDGGEFELAASLQPGRNEVSLQWRAATGEEGTLGPRIITSSRMPAWFNELPAAERPPTPLPEDLECSDVRGVYAWKRDGSSLVWVLPGTFEQGKRVSGTVDIHAGSVDQPRQTTLTRGYFLGRFEVTWKQFDAFRAAKGRQPSSRDIRYDVGAEPGVTGTRHIPRATPFRADDDHPAFKVSWEDAAAYCEWAGLRLPTEAEWEWAARGPDGLFLPWGSEPPRKGQCNAAIQGDGFTHTAPVGKFEEDRTRTQCFDMAANVQEWVQDVFGPITAEPATDPTGPRDGALRTVRGSPWSNTEGGISLTMREGVEPGHRTADNGFRVAR